MSNADALSLYYSRSVVFRRGDSLSRNTYNTPATVLDNAYQDHRIDDSNDKEE